MAPLTWKNVDSPSFSGVNDALRLAGQSFNAGFDALGSSLTDFQAGRTINDSNKLALDIMKYQDPAAYKAALAAGTVQAGVDPRNLNANAINFMAGHQKNLIGTKQAGAALVGTNINNATGQFNLDQSQSAAARADAQKAALPAAQALQARIQGLIETGSPDALAEVRRIQNSPDSVNTFIAAGMNPAGIMSNSAANFSTAMNQTNEIAKYGDQWKNRGIIKGAKVTGPQIAQQFGSASEAINFIKGNQKYSPEEQNAIISYIDSNQNMFKTIDPMDALFQQYENPPGTTPANNNNNNSSSTPDYSNGQAPFVTYSNQNAKRNDPLSGELVGRMDFLPGLGVTMNVSSGGQENNTTHGTGSTRHNHGNAADVQFKGPDGNILSWEKPADVPLLQRIVLEANKRGLNGFGAASDYMGATTTHIGFGPNGETGGAATVWGKGKGSKPYQALLDAFGGYNGTEMGSAPINPNPVQIQNSDGTVSTEPTMTIQDANDNWVNVPTIHNGIQYTEDAAKKLFKDGSIKAVGRYKTLDEAETAAQERTNAIGKMLEEAGVGRNISSITASDVNDAVFGINKSLPVNTKVPLGDVMSPAPPPQIPVDDAAQLANDAAMASSATNVPANTPTPVANPDVPVKDSAQSLINQLSMQQGFNPDKALEDAFANPSNTNETIGAAARRLTDPKGPLAGVDVKMMTNAIKQIKDENPGLATNIATILAEESIKYPEPKGFEIPYPFVNGGFELPIGIQNGKLGFINKDQLGAAVVDMDEIKRRIGEFAKSIDTNGDGSLDSYSTKSGVDRLTQSQQSGQMPKTVEGLNGLAVQLDAWLAQKEKAYSNSAGNSGIPINEIRADYERRMGIVQAELLKLGASPTSTAYTQGIIPK